MAAGRGAPLDARAARPGLGVAAAERTQQQPQVEDDAGPAGRHLHPEGGPAAVGEGGLQHRRLVAAGGQAGERGLARSEANQAVFHQPEPVRQRHHDVQRCQEEDKVEEEVAVGHSLGLVVNDLLTAFGVVVHHKLLLH